MAESGLKSAEHLALLVGEQALPHTEVAVAERPEGLAERGRRHLVQLAGQEQYC